MSLLKRRSMELYDPLRDFDSLWSRLTHPGWLEENPGFMVPATDVEERDDAYLLSIEMPGIKKEDLDVSLQDGILTIAAEHNEEQKEEKEGRIIRQERHYGKFMRQFDLGKDVTSDKLDASFKDGVLTVTVPRVAGEKQEPLHIPIH